MRSALVMACIGIALVSKASGRELLQTPAPRGPPRCTRPTPSNNNLGIDCGGLGGQWQADEFECHFGDYQLKCDYNTELLRQNQAKCKLEAPGAFNDRDFSCPIQNGRANCDWGKLGLPAEAESRARLIFDTWCAKE